MARRGSSSATQVLLPPGVGEKANQKLSEQLDEEVDDEDPKGDDAGDLGEPYEDPDTGDWHYGQKDEPKADEADPSVIDLEEFFQNLVEDEKIRDEIKLQCTEILELIKQDFEDRKPRDEQYDEGIKRTGLGKEAPGGAMFDGASRAVHPVLMEGCIDFAGKAIKELFPQNGPVRTSIVGKQTKEKVAKAERKRDHMNWQLTTQVKEFRNQLEQTLSQVPLGGTQYIHWWFEQGRTHTQFMPVDNVVIPVAAESHATASRITIREMELSEFEFQRRVEAELYCDPETPPDSMPPTEVSDSSQSSAKIEGKEQQGQNEEGTRSVLTTFCWLEVEGDKHSKGELFPYRLVLDWTDGKPLQLQRNWDPTLETEDVERMDWLVPFDFIVWRGALAIGLGQIIGSLAGTATGALRALLDTAHINNSATLLKLKGANIGGQSTQVQITQVGEIEGPPGIDDIRKLAMPMPFNQPSEVLFKLLDWIVMQAKGVVATADQKIADQNANTPVGTVLALIEQGSVTFSAIHARLHESMRRCLSILHRINKFWLEDEETLEDLGELIVYRDDYEGPMDVIPVSDPAIFSETQRAAQTQGLIQLRTLFPGMMIDRVILKRTLRMLKIPDVDELLPEEPKPKPQNPVAENLQMFMGQPAFAFPDQDHEPHMQSHLAFALDPNMGSNPAFILSFVPNFLEHMRQHVGFWYVQRSLEILSSLFGTDMSKEDYSSPEAQDALARALAQVAPLVMAESQRVMSQIGPILAQCYKMVQQIESAKAEQMKQMMGKGGGGSTPDPSRMANVQRQSAKDQAELQLKGQELQFKSQDLQFRQAQATRQEQLDAATTQADRERLQAEMQQAEHAQYLEEYALRVEEMAKSQGLEIDRETLRASLREQDLQHLISQEDNLTALTIADKQIAAGRRTNLKNGNAIGA